MKNKYLVKIMLACFMVILLLIPITWAYYEYRGQYTSILNFNGTIKLDAFDVLYPELRSEKSYGNTPENPYVVDNIIRLQNLIKLNNDGKLKNSKKSQGVSKYYFCLDFDNDELPQVLDLVNAGLFESIGNNEHPFEDELAGIVYGWDITGDDDYVILSGCLPKVEITTNNIQQTVLVNGVVDTALNYSDYHGNEGTYLKLEQYYDVNEFIAGDQDSIVFEKQEGENKVVKYIKTTDVTVLHQMIANETIVADAKQLDVGFISRISETGYVHDIILYNETISCSEEKEGLLHEFFATFFKSTDEAFTSHHFADTEGHSDERHVGFFAGHIDGAAGNISVAGVSQLNINTQEVNYYSQFTTVGYIYDYAVISGIQFNEISLDSVTEGGSVAGCLFADNIYQSVSTNASSSTDDDGAIHYELRDISKNLKNGWPGLNEDENKQQLQTFTYGSFNFILSNGNDTVSSIWNGTDSLEYLLGDDDYTITRSVLYIADEYRYSDEVKPGSSIQQSAASVKEMVFSGISSLKATGSVIDAGKYLITAKVEDSNKAGGYAYHAIKLVASQDETGNITYSFDKTANTDVTDFVLDTTGNKKLYQSALWEVRTGSKTPVFVNCRYEGNYLTRTDTTIGFATSNPSTFEYSSSSNRMYYSVKDEDTGTTTQYFVHYDASTHTFSMSTEGDTDIVLWYVNNGYNLRPVTSAEDIVANGDYVIVGRHTNGNSYLLGIDNTDNIISQKYANTDKSYVTAEFPTALTVEEYETIKNYIWNADSVANSQISFIDKSSLTYYIDVNDNDKYLALSTDQVTWGYNYNNGGVTLTRNNSMPNPTRYMNYTYAADATSTNFATSNDTSTLYLYRIVPQDDTPLYITYEGAKYVDADSTEITAGDYVIVGVNGNNNYALGLTTGATTNITHTDNIALSGNTPDIPATVTDNFKWTVAATSKTPTFKNIGKNTYYLRASTTAVNTNTSSMQWLYDASEKHMYFIDGGVKYYLVVNNTGTFSIKTEGQTGYSYIINLHKIVTKYSFSNVKIATSFTDGKCYLVSYADLSDTSRSQFLVGYQLNESNSPIIDNYDLSDKYTIIYPTGADPDDGITTTSSVTIETTAEMSNYAWIYEHTDRTVQINGRNETWLAYGYLYNYGYYNGGWSAVRATATDQQKKLYIGATSSGGSRTLTVSSTKQGGQSSGDATGFYYYTQANSTQYKGVRIGFKGLYNVYGLCDGDVEGSYKLISLGSRQNYDQGTDNRPYLDRTNEEYLNDATFRTKNSNVDPPKTYIYEADECTATSVLEKISSDGDELEQKMHYVIATSVVNSGVTNYMALTYEKDENGDPLFVGTDVSSQLSAIISAGKNGYKNSTNVPTNADWTNKSDNYKLRFYHTATSTNSVQNYIVASSSTTLNMISRSSKASITDLSIFYYDIINKVMKVEYNGTIYYLTYNSSLNTFGISSNASDACPIHVVRYTPTYKVEMVTDYYEDDEHEIPTLEDGDFIIAGRDTKGFTAIGTNGSALSLNFDITNYLTSKLSEEDYQSILNYVFKQVYFNYHDNVKYEDIVKGTSSDYVLLQIQTESNTGSFAMINDNLEPYSSAYQWKITKDADGKWKFVNYETIGSSTYNTRGIQYKSSTATSKLTIKDPNKAIGFYFGNLTSSATFDGNGSNIYVYDKTTYQRVNGSITSGSQYLLVAETNDLKFIIGNNNGTIINNYCVNDIATYASDSKYLWTFTTYDDGYSIKNNNHYARINGGKIELQTTTETNKYFSVEDGKIVYNTKSEYRPYSSNNGYASSTSTDNIMELYTYEKVSQSGFGTSYYYYYLTKATAPYSTNTDYCLVSKVGNNYYWVNLNGDNRMSLTYQNNGTYGGKYYYRVRTNKDITVNNYLVNVIVDPNNSSRYIIKNKSSANYLNATETSANVGTTQMYFEYSNTKGFYFYVVTPTNIELVGQNAFTAFKDPEGAETGSKIVLYKYVNNQFILLDKNLDGGKIVKNGQYIAVILDENNNYQIIGITPNSDTFTTTYCGTGGTGGTGILESTFADVVDNYKLLKASVEGAYGFALEFVGRTGKYLGTANNQIKVVSNSNTYWEISYDDVYTDNSRMFTVSLAVSDPKVLSVDGSRIIPVNSGVDTYLYNVTGNGPYTLNGLVNGNPTAGNNYVIAIYQDGCYYIVTKNSDGVVIPTAYGSGLPKTVDSTMLWTISGSTGNYSFKPYGDSAHYLRSSEDGVLILADSNANSNWAYTGTNITNTGAFKKAAPTRDSRDNTPLYIFKVSINDDLDKVSDTLTTLTGKTLVKSSLSVLDSTNYVITATYNGRVYAFSMRDKRTSQTLDITDTFNEAMAGNGNTIHLFSPSVWNQIGTDYTLIFDSLGFNSTDPNYFLLSGTDGNLYNGSPTVIEVEGQLENNVKTYADDFNTRPYEWQLHTYGDNQYIIGYDKEGQTQTNYIYFDTDTLTFKVTTDETVAKATNNKVELYQLGNTVKGTIFQTFAIAMKDDNVTIDSYPLNEAEPEDIETYNGTGVAADSTIENLVTGEYMIIASVGKSYYTVYLDKTGNIKMTDVSLLFSGNFMKDTAGKYCISINQDYLWKQTATPTIENGVASGLKLQNFTTKTNLVMNNTDALSYDGKQLYVTANGVNTYLNFSQDTGFTTSTSESNVNIRLYAIGTGSITEGGEEMQYSYYSYAINTNMIDFSLFDFSKVKITDLTRYANDEEGKLTTAQGWKLTGTTYLEEVNSSVYFAEGTPYSNDLSEFASSFEDITYKYVTTDEESDEVVNHQIAYSAPSGMVAFIVPEASAEEMAYINVIVSTELDSSSFDETQLRYLSMWKIADVDINTEAIEPIYESTETDANNYAYTLQQKFYKPDGAIPLPNHYGDDDNPAAYVKIKGEGENAVDQIYYLSDEDLGYDHLIAHTFSVTEPGLYYIGSTYGTVAFCYMSIDNMVAPEDGEDNSEVVAEDFTIDYVWGTVASTGEYGDDSSLGSVCYVGKRTTGNESQTWVHSNIYPKFVSGTSGSYEVGSDNKPIYPEGYNPTDELSLTVTRTFYDENENKPEESTFYVSKVTIAITTTTAIANPNSEGIPTGIMYSNMNNATKRTKRKVDFSVTLRAL